MTTQADLVAAVADRLETARIPFMVVGSVAGSLHGEPRTTVDIDLVIDPSPASLRQFVDSLAPDDYYVDLGAAMEVMERRTAFNVIEHATGWKVGIRPAHLPRRAAAEATPSIGGGTSSAAFCGCQRIYH